MLSRSSKIGADGTFKTCPNHYKQLYIIIAWFMGMVAPAAFVLLGGKKKETYIRMIKELKIACSSIGLVFLPKFVSLDFESGAIEAFKFEFRLIKFLGCWFHFGQALFRNLCDYGFKVEYSKDDELKFMFE